MPRAPRFALFALLGLLLPLVAALPVTGEPEAKEFKESNFKLQPPDGWQWMEIGSEMGSIGYVARLGRRAAGTVALVDIRVVPTHGLSVDELTEEVRAGMSQNLPDLQGSKVEAGKLGGLEGKLVTIKGVNANDADVLLKIYTVEALGKFHQMIITFIDGAEKPLGLEVENLRRAYRLLEGGGAAEKALAEGEYDGGDDGGMGHGGMGHGGEMPEGGPERDGNTFKFPDLNLEWTIPEGSPVELEGVTRDATSLPKKGPRRILTFRATRERKARSDTAPTENVLEVELYVRSSEGTGFPSDFAENSHNQEVIGEGYFDRVDFNRTKILKDLVIGNHKGAALEMGGATKAGEGKVEGTVIGETLILRFYWVRLGDVFYEWQTFIRGGKEAERLYAKVRDDLIDGIKFPTTTEAISGPIGISDVPFGSRERGAGLGKKKKFTSVGFKAEKPEFMSQLDFGDRKRNSILRLAWEKRAEDGQKYLYFDVQSWPHDVRQRNPEMDRISGREGQWRQEVQGADTKSKGDDVAFKSKWSKGKGLGYEFKGSFHGVPFVEKGWVVHYKSYMYWIRIQLGGEGAEDYFKSEIKKLKRAVKF